MSPAILQPRAEVRLRVTGDTLLPVRQLITGSTGRVDVAVPVDAHTLIVIRRLGYAARAIRVHAARNADTLEIALVPMAAKLGASITSASPTIQQLAVAGFYERRRIGIGTFLDSAVIAERSPLDLFSLLRPYLKGCTMIFIDGLRMLGLRDVDVREVIGIEIFRSNTEAPERFHNPAESAQRCGSIVIWRRI